MAAFTDLPFEIIERILTFLSMQRKAYCIPFTIFGRKWVDLARKTMMHTLYVAPKDVQSANKGLVRMERLSQHIRRLFIGPTKLDSLAIQILKHCKHVEELRLAYPLDVQNIRMLNKILGTSEIRRFSTQIIRASTTARSLSTWQAMPSLETLDLAELPSYTPKRSDVDVDEVGSEEQDALQSPGQTPQNTDLSFPCLKHLSLTHCSPACIPLSTLAKIAGQLLTVHIDWNVCVQYEDGSGRSQIPAFTAFRDTLANKITSMKLNGPCAPETAISVLKPLINLKQLTLFDIDFGMDSSVLAALPSGLERLIIYFPVRLRPYLFLCSYKSKEWLPNLKVCPRVLINFLTIKNPKSVQNELKFAKSAGKRASHRRNLPWTQRDAEFFFYEERCKYY